MFCIGEALGISAYFVYVKLVETKRQLKVPKSVTEVIKKLKLG
jgi:hypothetical protein